MTDIRSLVVRIERYLAWQESPEYEPCERCKGKGYHHGFGEHGHDPDWCSKCGGPGEQPTEPGTWDADAMLREAADALRAAGDRERDDWRLSFETSNEHVGKLEREKAQAEARVRELLAKIRALPSPWVVNKYWHVAINEKRECELWCRWCDARATGVEGDVIPHPDNGCPWSEALKADAPPAAPQILGVDLASGPDRTVFRCLCGFTTEDRDELMLHAHRCPGIEAAAPEPSQETGR